MFNSFYTAGLSHEPMGHKKPTPDKFYIGRWNVPAAHLSPSSTIRPNVLVPLTENFQDVMKMNKIM